MKIALTNTLIVNALHQGGRHGRGRWAPWMGKVGAVEEEGNALAGKISTVEEEKNALVGKVDALFGEGLIFGAGPSPLKMKYNMLCGRLCGEGIGHKNRPSPKYYGTFPKQPGDLPQATRRIPQNNQETVPITSQITN